MKKCVKLSKNLYIHECDNIEDYLQMCCVDDIDSLTKEQLFAWVRAGKTDMDTENSLWTVENGELGHFPDENKAVSLIKQAIKEGKSFYCTFITNESYGAIQKNNNEGRESFLMMVG